MNGQAMPTCSICTDYLGKYGGPVTLPCGLSQHIHLHALCPDAEPHPCRHSLARGALVEHGSKPCTAVEDVGPGVGPYHLRWCDDEEDEGPINQPWVAGQYTLPAFLLRTMT